MHTSETAFLSRLGSATADPAPNPQFDSLPRHGLTRQPRRVRLGLLGYGTVGQAVARLCRKSRDRWLRRGIDLIPTSALVRDRDRDREPLPYGAAVVDDSAQFLDRPHDVVIEAMGGIEPAGSLVEQALGRGTPVISANKSMLARHGLRLERLARSQGVELRFEAAVSAGLPFLDCLRGRPSSAQVDRIEAVLNGTCNFILTRMQRGASFVQALSEAQRLGLAEPDPSSDLKAIDPAEKLAILLGQIPGRAVEVDSIERTSLAGLGETDFALASNLGGVIKPIAWADLASATVEAFAGPCFVPAGHPLETVGGVENGIVLQRPRLGRLVYRGPGAGPEVTAAALLDDLCETLSRPQRSQASWTPPDTGHEICMSANTSWMVRLEFPKSPPHPDELCEFLASHGIWAFRWTTHGNGRFAFLSNKLSRRKLEDALVALRHASGCASEHIRALPFETGENCDEETLPD